MRGRRSEGDRLVELAEEQANATRKAEFEALAKLLEGGFVGLAKVIASRPVL